MLYMSVPTPLLAYDEYDALCACGGGWRYLCRNPLCTIFAIS